MARTYSKPSSLPGRILARMFLVLLGFLIGVALFTPWRKIWATALVELDASLPSVGLTWQKIDRDGPFGFRVRDLRITVARTPGDLHFKNAYVNMGFSPLAKVRLDTGGPQCEMELFSNGVFTFEGDLNLTYLLGDGDFKGILHTSGSLFLPAGAVLPKDGWIDVRAQHLILPGEKAIGDLAFTAVLDNAKMDVRDFTLRSPLSYKSSGTGIIDPDNLYRTFFDLKGDMTIGRESFPYEMKGTLAEAIWFK